jgi:hypothetical protein
MADTMEVHAGLLLRARALNRLRPDLAERVIRGEIKIDSDDTRRDMWRAMWALMSKAAEAGQA